MRTQVNYTYSNLEKYYCTGYYFSFTLICLFNTYFIAKWMHLLYSHFKWRNTRWAAATCMWVSFSSITPLQRGSLVIELKSFMKGFEYSDPLHLPVAQTLWFPLSQQNFHCGCHMLPPLRPLNSQQSTKQQTVSPKMEDD